MLHSIILGTGQPLLILHGFLGMADNWKTLGKQWSNTGYQVHLIDQRNHGRSMHSQQFDYITLAQDINNYCQQHQLTDIYLIGHSMGGKVAMRVAADYPKLVRKLIIVDIAPKNYPPHHSDIFKGLSAINLQKLESRKQADQQLSQYIPDYGTRQFLLKNLYRNNNKQYNWRFNLTRLSECQDLIGSHDPIQNPITIPTLFVKGSKSGYILDQDRVIIDHAFAKASIISIPDAGHWLHAEQPELFYQKVTQFMSNKNTPT